MGSLPPGPPPPAPPAGAVPIDIMAKRAEIQAKLAAMRKMAPGGGGAAPSPPPPSSAPPPPPPNLPAVPGLPRPNLDPDLAKKVADAKRLVESMQAKKRAAAMPANPYLVSLRSRRRSPNTRADSVLSRNSLLLRPKRTILFSTLLLLDVEDWPWLLTRC